MFIAACRRILFCIMESNIQPSFQDLYEQKPDNNSIIMCLARHAATGREVDTALVLNLIDRAQPDPESLRAMQYAASLGITAQQKLGNQPLAEQYGSILVDLELRIAQDV